MIEEIKRNHLWMKAIIGMLKKRLVKSSAKQ